MMPRPLLIGLYASTILPMIVGFWVPALTQLGIILCLLIFLFSLVDLAVSPRLALIDVYRDCGEVFSLGARNPVRIWGRNRNRRPVRLRVHDEYMQTAEVENLPLILDIAEGQTRHATWYLIPEQRGQTRFGQLFLQLDSRWKLWTLATERTQEQPIRIYPDIQSVASVELLARRNRLAEAGVRLSRLRGRGTDFDRLREYRRTDEFRQIDWKATARRQELVSREYVVERNQSILLVLDCGRSMCNADQGIRHFDRALNAIIRLAHIAMRQGDTVSLLAGSNQLHKWVPPIRGAQGIRRLVSQIYDLQPTYDATDYELLTDEVRRRNRKRSLVIFVSHLLDEVHLDAISPHLHRLRSPHLVLAALLGNQPLMERLETVPENSHAAFALAAAAEMIGEQTRRVAKLQQAGLLVLECAPDQMSSALISQYLEIKARHLL